MIHGRASSASDVTKLGLSIPPTHTCAHTCAHTHRHNSYSSSSTRAALHRNGSQGGAPGERGSVLTCRKQTAGDSGRCLSALLEVSSDELARIWAGCSLDSCGCTDIPFVPAREPWGVSPLPRPLQVDQPLIEGRDRTACHSQLLAEVSESDGDKPRGAEWVCGWRDRPAE